MAYGTVKVDNITFTNGGIDQTVTVSGIVQSISGNITATGTIQGATIIGTSTVSGATVTGDAGVFTTVTGGSAGFTTVTGTTVTGTTANFATLSGTTITGSVGNFGSGSAAAPSVSVGTTDNGIYSPGADQVAISTNGAGRLFVDADGNVGVGVATPSARLHSFLGNNSRSWTPVAATSALFERNSVNYVTIEASSASTSALTFADEDSQTIGGIRYNHPADYMGFDVNGSERLRITSDGKLGLGTSSPSTLLHLSSATGSASPTPTELRIATTTNASDWSTTDPWGRISFYSADTSGAGPKIHAAIDAISQDNFQGVSSLNFRTSLSDGTLPVRMTINNTGNVGVGTTSPDEALEVAGDIKLSNTSTRIIFEDTDSTNLSINRFSSYDGALIAEADVNNNGSVGSTFRVNVDGTERARIDSSGRLLVGTSTTLGNSEILQINSTSAANVVGLYRQSDDTAGPRLYLTKTRGSATSIVSNNDALGEIRFAGSDGVDVASFAAAIYAYVDGTPGTNDMPGRLVFSTTADGASSPTERLRIDSSGRLLVGTSTSVQVPLSSSTLGDPGKQLASASQAGATSAQYAYSTTATVAPNLVLARSRGALNTQGLVSSNDSLGRIVFEGSDGQTVGTNSGFIRAAAIEAQVDGTASAGDMPGRLVFSTTADGASSPTERLRITSDGKLGLGSSSPSELFDIQRANNAGNVGLRLVQVGQVEYKIGINDADDKLYITNNNGDAAIGSNAKGIVITAGGLVGVGTTSPDTKLNVVQSSTGRAWSATSGVGDLIVERNGNAGLAIIAANTSFSSINFGDTDDENAGFITYYHNDDALTFRTNGSGEDVRIDSSGRLLVGTSTSIAGPYSYARDVQFNAASGLQLSRFSADAFSSRVTLVKSRNATTGQHTAVVSSDVLGEIEFAGSDGTSFLEGARIRAEVDNGATGTALTGSEMPGRIVFSTTADGAASPTERMRIDAAGNTLFVSSSNKAGIDAGTADGKYFSSTGGILISSRIATTTVNHQTFINGNGAVGSISTNGSATAYNTSSDYRLKENVTAVTDGITRLQQLKPSRFNFIADPDKTVDGFLAHEVQDIVPEAITGEKDAVDENGDPQYQGIDQSKLVPLLTAALQEAIGRIETLEAEVAALKAQ